MVSTRRPTVASRTLAEQLRPVVHVHGAVRETQYAQFDVERARTRLRAGRTAFDAAALIADAGDLTAAFKRTSQAFERTGIASTPEMAALQQRSVDATLVVLAWANAE